MPTAPFLAALEAAVAVLRATVHTEFAGLNTDQLHHRPAPGSWNILECLEHLNLYSRYYNPALARALAGPVAAPTRAREAPVRYSWLGRKSIAMMQPGNASQSRTLRRLNPLGSPLGPAVLAEFDQHQAQLLALLARARPADLNRRAVPVEFFRLLRLRLGEALEFVVVHQQRHVQQARRALASQRAVGPADVLTAEPTSA